MKRILIAVLACLPALASSQQGWTRTIPDQSDSQEVDLSSITSQGDEWSAWTRSRFVIAREFPAGTKIESGSVHHLKLAVRCKPEGMSFRALSTKLVGPNGNVGFEASKDLDKTYPPIDGMEYGASAPGLICAAALAQKNGRKMPWPMKKSEHRSFVNSML
ncbi:MAG: hypothetical protein RLZZ618_1230 [Pseudomonadota bacterium]|jgi:hypothetical protein